MNVTPYQNITISGGIAVGTTTLLENLKPYLLPKKWRFYSGGEMLKKYAIKSGKYIAKNKLHHMANMYSDDVDKTFDAEITKKLSVKKHIVIESWLAGFFARKIDTVLRVLLICSNSDVVTDRFVNRDNIDLKDAKHILYTRENENFKKWRRMYGKFNFFDKKYYTMVIDTAFNSPQETVDIVLSALQF